MPAPFATFAVLSGCRPGTRLFVTFRAFGYDRDEEVSIDLVTSDADPTGIRRPGIRVTRHDGSAFWLLPRRSALAPVGAWTGPTVGQPMSPIVGLQILPA
jgi:hypothetical protein